MTTLAAAARYNGVDQTTIEKHQRVIDELSNRGCTCEKTMKIALYVLGALALIGAVAVGALAFSGVLSTSFAWTAIPLAILGLASIYTASKLNN